MKLLHTSDWHLGQNFMGQSRRGEHEAFLGWLLGVIEEEAIDVLLVCGDIFDTGTPPNYALELYYNFLTHLSRLPVTTIITAGNHDSIATLKAPKELLKVLNIHIIASGDEGEEEVIPITREGEMRGVVCAVPFLREGLIRQSLSGETLTQKEKQANEGIKAYYEKSYTKAQTIRGDKVIPIIAMGHLTTVGARRSESEKEIYIGGTLDIGGEYLGAMFDYVALGHLHLAQKVGDEHIRYSGSPIPLSFSEAGQPKKVAIITFRGGGLEVVERNIPLTRELFVLKGGATILQHELQKIENKEAWIEIHLADDNPMHANLELRLKASTLGLTLLAVKIDKSQKQLQAKEFKAISLDELGVEEVFAKRLEQEEIEEKEFERQLTTSFKQIVAKVETL